MAARQNRTSARVIIARKREAEALELRLAGGTYEQIAQAIGYETRSAAYRAVVRALRSLSKVQDVEHLRELESERLDRLFLGVWAKAVKGDDHKIDRVIKIMVRRAKLLGLDAPVRQELTGRGGGPIQLDHRTVAEVDSEIGRLVGEVASQEEANPGEPLEEPTLDELPSGFDPPGLVSGPPAD